MDWEERCLRLCAAVLVAAVLLRLSAGGAFTAVGKALENPEVASFLVYLQTGRVVRLRQEIPTLPPAETAAEETTQPPEPETVEFSPEDTALIDVKYNCSRSPDLAALLTEPMDWDLTGDAPTVLILHTHTSECYTRDDGEEFELSGSYRTLDPGYNLLCLGELVAEELESAGIGVIHDTQFHDYPSYNGAYADAAASTEAILAEYPSIRLVLDLHRDAADTDYGQMVTSCSVDGETSAQLMFVVGTDAGTLPHPDWEKNLSLALKLQVLLERDNPGICRNLNLTYQRYNQHLGERALLIEIGAAGNTLSEAKIAARELAQAIIALKNGG